MSRKQQGQLETTTLRGVRANSPAHGGSTERKRGVSMLVRGLNINHGRSRTVLANARTLLERSVHIYVRLKFGRGCFYSCSGCCQNIRVLFTAFPVSSDQGETAQFQ